MHDLDFLVATPNAARRCLANSSPHRSPQASSPTATTKSSMRLANRLPVRPARGQRPEFPFALDYFTGSKEHNIAMRSRALDRGWSLNEYRLAPKRTRRRHRSTFTKKPTSTARSASITSSPSCARTAARSKPPRPARLPELVELGEPARHLPQPHHRQRRHATPSKRWPTPPRELGLQYLGIADHSKASFQANGLDEERLLAQIAAHPRTQRRSSDGELPPLRRQRGGYPQGRLARFP